jgi:hypothetical protein
MHHALLHDGCCMVPVGSFRVIFKGGLFSFWCDGRTLNSATTQSEKEPKEPRLKHNDKHQTNIRAKPIKKVRGSSFEDEYSV